MVAGFGSFSVLVGFATFVWALVGILLTVCVFGGSNPLSVPKGGGYVGYIRKALEKGFLEDPGLHPVLLTCLRILSVLDGACAACCPFLSTRSCHVCIQIYGNCCCLSRCTTEAFGWLDFGSTPDPVNVQPHPGYVWLKSEYSEAIPWRKVQLTKQQNLDLTTDGLWAMPLNTGWVPVKERRLGDWEKLKKYVPVHKRGDFCPNGIPALPEKGNANHDDDSE